MSDMAGKVVLVTGATDGIGRATALGLARLGARLLVHGRDPERVAAAARETAAAGPERADGFVADLSVQDEVRRLAKQVRRAAPRLDVLVNNAGVYMRDRRLTPDGIEQTFAVNVLAPFLLTQLLLEALEAAAPSRVVNVASMAHSHARLDLAALTGGGSWHGGEAYGASKLALVLLTAESAERLAGLGVTVNSLHPGVVRTKLLRAGWPYGTVTGGAVDRGARTSIYLAASPEVEGVTGLYFAQSRPAQPSPLVHDRALRRRLWGECLRLTGLVPQGAGAAAGAGRGGAGSHAA